MIGVKYEDKYPVEEFFNLFRVPWEWYEPGREYEVVIARKSEVPEYTGNLIDLDKDFLYRAFVETDTCLNDGVYRQYYPLLNEWITRFRNLLMEYMTVVEILPQPYGYPYIVVPTHDVDNISARQSSFRTIGVAALRCFSQHEFKAGVDLLLSKLGIVHDSWDLFGEWVALERSLGVRSTFFFIPTHPVLDEYYHKFREISYQIDSDVLNELSRYGWEIGTHGMNNWLSPGLGMGERIFYGRGNRTHWLLHKKDSWLNLDLAGYDYDATFGYDENVGFRAGIAQVYRPRGCENLLVLPLMIQDAALFGRSCWILQTDPDLATHGSFIRYPALNLSDEGARDICTHLFDEMLKYGGVISLLWHYENIVPPRDWRAFYLLMITRARFDGAWITTAQNAVDWFRMRRSARFEVVRSGKEIRILADVHSNPLSIRIHVDPENVWGCDCPFIAGDSYIDVCCLKNDITVMLK